MRLAKLALRRAGDTNGPLPGKPRRILLSAAVVWLALVAGGLWLLCGYENAPGVSATPPEKWPAASQIHPALNQATLIILAHPHCPCTRASIGELAAIMAHCQGRLTAYILFIKPPGVSDDWEMTDLWQTASHIPGVRVIQDDDGSEARLFQAATSGQAILYDVHGRLLFTGGITASRGHSGDNAGRSAIVSLVNAGSADRSETFVFGCPLFDPQTECKVTRDERTKR